MRRFRSEAWAIPEQPATLRPDRVLLRAADSEGPPGDAAISQPSLGYSARALEQSLNFRRSAVCDARPRLWRLRVQILSTLRGPFGVGRPRFW